MAELGERAYLFSLGVSDLDPSISDHPSGLYDHATVAALSAAAACQFRGPCWLVLEAGRGDVYTPDGGRLHAHVIADREDGPQHITPDTERCKWVYDAPGAWRYLHKADPKTLDALIDYTAARVLSPTGKTPRTRRTFRSAARSTWLESNRVRADPLPPVLPCGRCRVRHLSGCPQCTKPNVSAQPTRTRGDRPAQGASTPLQPVPPTSKPSTPERPRPITAPHRRNLVITTAAPLHSPRGGRTHGPAP